jgi:hypothetical protein
VGGNSRCDSSRLSSAYLVAGQLGYLRPSRVGASRLSTRQRVCQNPRFFLRDVSRHRLYRRFGRFATVPRLAVGGYVGCICSLCFRVTSKEAVRHSLLFATCNRRCVFFRLFWCICTEESIYQQSLWAIAIRFDFLRRRTANTHNFTDASPRHLFDRLAERSLHGWHIS